MKIIAEVTSKFNQHGYSTLKVERVESYQVDSAMDTDTDTWSIGIGDPDRELSAVLRRDNEVRVSLRGYGDGKIATLNTGFVDEASYNEDGILTLNGRDVTSPAVDSQHPPGNFKLVRPEVFVRKGATELKIASNLQLAKAGSFKKFNVDGSESYWEAWYRLYRKKNMWMWAEADGSIFANKLNYNTNPVYYFGSPSGVMSGKNFLPVEVAEIRSNKQQRVWECYVIGNRGDIGFSVRVKDRTIGDWIKRPTKYITSKAAHGPGEARGEAWEELFEGKVGAIEIKLTIANPGHVIRQNRVAYVNIPSIGLKGEFYVVGSISFGTTESGLYQEVRLREKNYAISRRDPDDPDVKETPSEKTLFGSGGVGSSLDVRWKYHFVEAANKHHGPWPYELFLGVLLSICQHESSFRNLRSGGNTEYPENPPSPITNPAAYKKFVQTFSNEAAKGIPNKWQAVGPMQLHSQGFKEEADKLAGGPIDDLAGGRWIPRYNIIEGAAVLRGKLVSSGAEAALGGGSAENLIWQGVNAYAGGAQYGGAQYTAEIKKIYEDKFQQIVEEAVVEARTPKRSTGGYLDPGAKQGIMVVLQRALDEQRLHGYNYSQRRPYASSLFSSDARLRGIDCSAFYILAHKEAGLDDPNQSNFDGSGYTGSLVKRGTWTDSPQPGDAAFYGSSRFMPSHVMVYAGNDQVVGIGGPIGIHKTTLRYRADFLGTMRY